MHKRIACLIFTLITMSLVGCDGLRNEDAGVLTGGVVGAALGNTIGGGDGRVLATIGGTVLGAYIGGRVGRSMDKTDHQAFSNALEHQPTNDVYTWVNPDSHNRYTVKPTKTYYRKGQPCRSYVTTALIDGKAEKITGKACRLANGSWKTIS